MRFCQLVRYFYVGTSPRRVNWFWPRWWCELKVSRTWIPVNGVWFLSAVSLKLTRTRNPILKYYCSARFMLLHIRPTKQTKLTPKISSLDFHDNGDAPHICLIGFFLQFRWSILALYVTSPHFCPDPYCRLIMLYHVIEGTHLDGIFTQIVSQTILFLFQVCFCCVMPVLNFWPLTIPPFWLCETGEPHLQPDTDRKCSYC